MVTFTALCAELRIAEMLLRDEATRLTSLARLIAKAIDAAERAGHDSACLAVHGTPARLERNAAIRMRYANGERQAVIARDLGLSPSRVFQIIRKRNR